MLRLLGTPPPPMMAVLVNHIIWTDVLDSMLTFVVSRPWHEKEEEEVQEGER